MKRALFLAGACAVYSLAAWSVRPGFYDSFPAPQYDYVSPPPVLAPGNIAPTPGSADVTEAGGFVATRDQPIAQASIRISPGTLTGPAHVDVKPYAPPHPGDVTLEGNVYCVTANTTLKPGSTAEVTLLLPANEPFPSAMYYSPTQTGPWTSLGGRWTWPRI